MAKSKTAVPAHPYNMAQVRTAGQMLRRDADGELELGTVAHRCNLSTEALKDLLPHWADVYKDHIHFAEAAGHPLCKAKASASNADPMA